MVNIEVEQKGPEDFNSYYSSRENSKGPSFNRMQNDLKEDPEPEPIRPMAQNFMQSNDVVKP